MIEFLATVVAFVLGRGTALILTVLSWAPPLWARILASIALPVAAAVWLRHVNRVVRR